MIRRVAVACVLVGVVTVGGGVLATRHDSPPARAALPTDAGTIPEAPAAGRPSSRPTSLPSGSRLEYPRLHVDAPITGVGLDGRVMQVPRDPRVVGLWRGGAVPGAGRGSVVVVGHVNYAGTTGEFAALPKARPDDRVSVGDHTYRVAAVRTYAKTNGIPDAAFATGGGERLVLITCGGPFDARTGNYVDNVVVYAVPA